MRLSIVGDEIAYDIKDQVDLLLQLGISNIELRKISGINIVECDKKTVQKVVEILKTNQINVTMISTNIGKKERTRIQTYRAFSFALQLAGNLNCDFIRIFSDIGRKGNPNIGLLRRLTKKASRKKVHVVLENEVGTFADNPIVCQELVEKTNKKLALLFDIGNFYKCGFSVDQAYSLLKDSVAYIHLKDMESGTYKWRYLGEGDLSINVFLRAILQNCYRGYISLEPHFCVDSPEERRKLCINYIGKIKQDFSNYIELSD